MRIKTYIILFAWLFPTVCFAQDLQPYSGRVSVSVVADDNIKGKIESYICREFRSLGDIVVTDDKPDWILNIVALETHTKGGHKSGIVLSTVILVPFNNKYIVNEVSAKSKSWVSKATSDLFTVSDNWLRVGAPRDLRSMCNGIVADFDNEHIKFIRDMWQTIIDNKNKGTKPEK